MVRLSSIAAALAVPLAACSAGPAPTLDTTAPLVAAEPRGETITGLTVDRVVDGDTIKVTVDGYQVSVRLIGINTPETVKPDSPVECFGPEASAFAESLLDGQPITLELDSTQGYYDKYDRLLAYVWRVQPDGSLRLFNEEAVAGGFAYERQYTDTPYVWKDALAAAQRGAQDAQRGLWGACEP